MPVPTSFGPDTEPLVSVIIPCWNADAWLAETLTSALAQSGVALEIIVVDDGSTDQSLAVIDAVGGSAVRLIRQDHRGVSHARNAGTDAASGVFVQYLDADDVLMPGTLAARVKVLIESDAEVAYCDWVRWERSADGTFASGAAVARTLGPRPDTDLLTDFWWPPGALLYRRTLMDRGLRWNERLPIIQDARFQLDAALAGARFVHVPGIGLKYRVHGAGSLSRKDPVSFDADCFRNAAELHDAWQRDGSLDRERSRALVKVYGRLARVFFAIDRDRFHEVLSRLKTLDPQYVPPGPPAFRRLTQLVGYPASEHVASWWRTLRASVGGRP